ncbi:MAG: hypothetical protein ABL917_00910 [Parcubacteria group bacterium]
MNNEDGLSLSTKIISGVVLVAVVAFGYYFFSREDKVVNKTQLQIEEGKLEELMVRRNAEREVVNQIQEQYSNLRNTIMKNTDVFFKDANSNNPRIILKIKDKKVEAEINKRRLEITRLLEAWDKKVDDLESTSITEPNSVTLMDLVAGAKNDVDYVKQYIKELQSIINNITPANSKLDDSQIKTYENIINNSLNQIEQVASNVNAIETSIPAIYEALGITNSNNTPIPQENLPTLLTPTPTPTPPIVTETQIQNQQQVVNQTAQNGGQQNSTTTTPVPTPTPTQDPYLYYPVYSQYGAAQTIIEYLQSLPSPNIDKSGWPDIDTSAGDPILFDN